MFHSRFRSFLSSARVLGIALCIVMLAGCIVRSDPTATRDQTGMTTSKTIGPRGGELAAGGFKLVFPEGALASDMLVSVAQDPNPPPKPAGLVSAGPAYKVSLPPDYILPVPVELSLPFQRQSGLNENCYGAYLWDGKEWLFAGGVIEGDVIRAEVHRFSTFQAGACSTSEERPVLFVNLSSNEQNPRHPSVTPWRVTLTDPSCGGGIGRLYTLVNRCGGDWGQNCGGLQTYHWGTYFTWCFWWQEPAVGTNLMVSYHIYVNNTVSLNAQSVTLQEYRSHKAMPPIVAVTLPPRGGGITGMCGQDVSQAGPTVAPTSQPGGARPTTAPVTVQPTAALRGAQQTAVPTPTITAVPVPPTSAPSPTARPPTATATRRPATPSPAPTSVPTVAPDIRNNIASENHLHFSSPTVIRLAHGVDFVVLTGPIKVTVAVQHRPTDNGVWIQEPVYTVQLRAGETRKFVQEERTSRYPGDWDMTITLVSQ